MAARWRVVLGVGYVAVLAAAVVYVAMTGTTLRGSSPAPAPPAPGADGGPGPAATEDPIVVLRASDQFAEFAEPARARAAPWARIAYDNFAPRVGGQRVEWTNKDALWNQLASPIRDQLLQLGPEYRQPLWDNNTAVPNAVEIPWSNEATGGRGDYVEFAGTYLSNSGPIRRYWGFLIQNAGGRGVVVARMSPLEIREADYPNLDAALERLQEVTWQWIESQPSA